MFGRSCMGWLAPISALGMMGCAQIFGLDGEPTLKDSTSATGGEGTGGVGGDSGCGGEGGNLTYAEFVSCDEPSAYFRFDEPSTATDFADDITAQTLPRGAAITTAGCRSNGLRFDDGISFSKSTDPLGDLRSGGVHTIEAWVKLASLPTASEQIWARRDASETLLGMVLGLEKMPPRLTFFVGDGAGSRAPSLVLDDTWVGRCLHAVAVADTTTISLYVDGALREAKQRNGLGDVPVPSQLRLGGGIPVLFRGTLDEFAVYDRALTPAEILAHYEAGKSL